MSYAIDGNSESFRRTPNFSDNEVTALLLAVRKRKEVIESKRANLTTKLNKEIAWNQVVADYNASVKIKRDSRQLKNKYVHFKQHFKNRLTEHKKKLDSTETGVIVVPALTAGEEIMLDILTEEQREIQGEIDDSEDPGPQQEIIPGPDIELDDEKEIINRRPKRRKTIKNLAGEITYLRRKVVEEELTVLQNRIAYEREAHETKMQHEREIHALCVEKLRAEYYDEKPEGLTTMDLL